MGFSFTKIYTIDFLFKRSEFNTTEIELVAIATDAKIGFKSIWKNGYKMPIATGIRIIL